MKLLVIVIIIIIIKMVDVNLNHVAIYHFYMNIGGDVYIKL